VIAIQPRRTPEYESQGGPTTVASAPKRTDRLAWWSSVLMVELSLGAFGVGVTTPPRSGPCCLHDCVVYPYPGVYPCLSCSWRASRTGLQMTGNYRAGSDSALQ
jgi:hypothetical protein